MGIYDTIKNEIKKIIISANGKKWDSGIHYVALLEIYGLELKTRPQMSGIK